MTIDAYSITFAGVISVFVLKLVCFVLGYLIVRLGAQLLREGVTGAFKFSADMKGAKADLASASPGLLFVLLGVILIGYAMWVPKAFDLRQEGGAAEGAPRTGPPDVHLPK